MDILAEMKLNIISRAERMWNMNWPISCIQQAEKIVLTSMYGVAWNDKSTQTWKRVLVVRCLCDDTTLQSLYVQLLQLKQMNITTINTGKKTKQARKQSKPYVCVLVNLTVTVDER